MVKSSDCLHISKESIDRDRQMMGEQSDEFRSKHLAEFCDDDGRNCIRAEDVRLAMDDPPAFEDGPDAYFIDWSATADGDEIVIAYWSRNRADLQIDAGSVFPSGKNSLRDAKDFFLDILARINSKRYCL